MSWMSARAVCERSAAVRPVADRDLIWLHWRTSEQSRLSLGSYGRPRMTEELKDIGHRRMGRLMCQNGI